MRNRGIPHDELTWCDNGIGGGDWVLHTNTEIFGSVQVTIPVMSNSLPLRDIQQRSLQMLRELPKSLKPSMIDSLPLEDVASELALNDTH